MVSLLAYLDKMYYLYLITYCNFQSLGHNYDKYQNGIEQNFPQDGKSSLMKTIKKFASSKQDMIDPITVRPF